MILPGILRLEVDHINDLRNSKPSAPVGPDDLVLEEPGSEPDPGPGGTHVAAHPGTEAGVGEGGGDHLALVVTEPVEDEVLVLGPAPCGTTAEAPGQLVWVEGDVPPGGDLEEEERHQASRACEETQQQSEVSDLVCQESRQRWSEYEEYRDYGIHNRSLLYRHA